MREIFRLLNNNIFFYYTSRLKHFTKNNQKYHSVHEITLLSKDTNRKIEISINKIIKNENNEWDGMLLIFIFYYGFELNRKDETFLFKQKDLSRRNIIKEFNNYIYIKLCDEAIYKKYNFEII